MEENVETRLRGLFVLQHIDLQLDELESQKGDLPHQVATLVEQHKALQTQLEQLRSLVTESIILRDKTDVEVISYAGKIEKYKEQQYQVRNNREYDALTREIELAQLTSLKLQKQMEETEGRAQVAKGDIEKFHADLEILEKELGEKREELESVSKMNEDEELKLKHEREKIVRRVAKDDLEQYERIRKAKGGRAVVDVRRGACGGCFNRIPPQRLLELRKNDEIFRCEHCGRIYVSDEIASAQLSVS